MAAKFYHDDTPAEIKNAKVRQCSPRDLEQELTSTGTASNHNINTQWQKGTDNAGRAESSIWNTMWILKRKLASDLNVTC
jgi:hypothetical protein